MNIKNIKHNLEQMIAEWREYADGDYCQTYNRGMAQGLRMAAGRLDDYIFALEMAEPQSAESATPLSRCTQRADSREDAERG